MNLWKKFMTTDKKLSMLFSLSYFFCLIALYSWNGLIVILLSVFFFGLPLLIFGFPFLSFLLLSHNKKSICFGYIASLTSIGYLFKALCNFPLKQITDEAVHETTLSMAHSIVIVLSIVMFLLSATLLFFYKIKKIVKHDA